MNVAVTTSGEQGQSDGSLFDVALAPHQTRIINLDDKKPAFTTTAGAGKMGGISITHTGAPGGVLAFGLLSKKQTGFSSHFPFEDPATSRSQTLAAAHVFIGKPDTPGFSRETRFTSIALIRNASDAALAVKPSISFVYKNAPRTVNLDGRHLLPEQVDAIDLAAELKRAGILGALSGAGLTLASTGNPGALMAHLTSYDQTRNHVFDVPMKDPSIKMNRFSGSYPFNLEGGRQSVVHVRNTTGEKARFTVQLDFELVSYTLPIQILDPQQEAAIDIRQLRDSQTPDSIDRVIPKEVTSGQANWHEHGPQALIGRLEEFDVGQAMASSFSCPGPGCCLSTEIVVTAPGSMSKALGETGHFKLLESRRLDCDGTIYGPFDVSADASWSSTNASVVTVGAVSSSGVLCSFVGVGQANVHADFQGIISQVDPISETCEGTFSPFPEDGPVEVKPVVSSLQVSMPSTRNPVTGQAPPAGTLQVTNTATAFATDTSSDLVAVFQSSTVLLTVTATGVTPASSASQLRWKIDRDPSDTVASATPGLSATVGAQVSITPSTAGNFRLICFFDTNANSAYESGEELRILRFAVVRATLVTGTTVTSIDSGGLNYAGGAQGGGDFAVISQSNPALMLIQCRVLLEGGGSNRRIGVDNMQLGVVGNLTSDTSKVNYGASGMGTETPNQNLPMVDSPADPSGGATAFRSNSQFSMTNVSGGGKHANVAGDDDPDVGPFKIVHPSIGVTWTSTQGGYDFREYIVGYSNSFTKYYVVFARANLSVRVNGNNSGGNWVNNGSTLTLQGSTTRPQNLTNAITNNSPQSGDDAGIQPLGKTYANQTNRPFVYTQ